MGHPYHLSTTVNHTDLAIENGCRQLNDFFLIVIG